MIDVRRKLYEIVLNLWLYTVLELFNLKVLSNSSSEPTSEKVSFRMDLNNNTFSDLNSRRTLRRDRRRLFWIFALFTMNQKGLVETGCGPDLSSK
jgi:hypothetical protein